MSPTHAATPCVEPGCFNLATVKGRCAQCQLIRGGGRVVYDQQRGSARERGYDRTWERRRKWHLEAEPFCRIGGHPGNQVDHVIPHRGVKWLFELKGNLQTLCKSHHTKKTVEERKIPIGMMYPLNLPEPPHYRPTRLMCGPTIYEGHRRIETTTNEVVGIYGDNEDFGQRNLALREELSQETNTPLLLAITAPRTAERAFWSRVMDCEAELVMPIEGAMEGHPKEWWDHYMLDQRAEEAMARRLA